MNLYCTIGAAPLNGARTTFSSIFGLSAIGDDQAFPINKPVRSRPLGRADERHGKGLFRTSSSVMALSVHRGVRATSVLRGQRRGIRTQAFVFACEGAVIRISRKPPAASDSRTLGRISAEIRTLRLVGVGTGQWKIRAVLSGGFETESEQRRGGHSTTLIRLTNALGGYASLRTGPKVRT
jgi:hypothetical protein